MVGSWLNSNMGRGGRVLVQRVDYYDMHIHSLRLGPSVSFDHTGEDRKSIVTNRGSQLGVDYTDQVLIKIESCFD